MFSLTLEMLSNNLELFISVDRLCWKTLIYQINHSLVSAMEFSLDLVQIRIDSISVLDRAPSIQEAMQNSVLSPLEIGENFDDFVEKMCDVLENEPPLNVAAFAHNEFTRIHPFKANNGRTARLFMIFLLFKGDCKKNHEHDCWARGLRWIESVRRSMWNVDCGGLRVGNLMGFQAHSELPRCECNLAELIECVSTPSRIVFLEKRSTRARIKQT